MFFFVAVYGDQLDLHVLTHSFPTRRSSDLLAAGEEKAWALFGVVLAHPALQIDMADGEIERVDQFGVVRRDAVPPEGQLPIEDTVIDAFGVQPQFAPAWAIQRKWQVPGRRNRG